MKKIESGRSMIEMLGVLAIIGVLSIGGLAGYTMAMNRWRANTLMDYVSRCVVVAQTKGVTGAPAYGEGTSAATGKCADILSEAVPGFLTGDKKVYISNYTPNTDATTVIATTISDAVDKVLKDKFSCPASGYGTCKNISGVKYTAKGTFLFQNSAN